MNLPKSFLVVIGISVLGLLWFDNCLFAQQVKVSGIVRLVDKTEVKDANVRLFLDGTFIGDATTGAVNGKSPGYYEITATTNAPAGSMSISVYPADLTKHCPVTIDQLSEKDVQRLSVVIYDQPALKELAMRAAEGERINVAPLWSQLASIEATYFAALQEGIEPTDLNKRFAIMLEEIVPESKVAASAPTATKAVFQKGMFLRRLFTSNGREK